MKNGPVSIDGPVFNYNEGFCNSTDRRHNYAAASSAAEGTVGVTGGTGVTGGSAAGCRVPTNVTRFC